MSLFLFWLVVFTVAEATTSVSIDKHAQITVSNDDVNVISKIDKVIVCSSNSADGGSNNNNNGAVARTLDVAKKCETDGFIQYEIQTAKNNRIYHPHLSRVAGDYYFAQINVKLYNKLTGAVGEETHIVRIEVTRQDMVSVTLGCMTLAIVCVFAVVAVARRKKQRPLFNTQSMDTLAADIGLYSTVNLMK